MVMRRWLASAGIALSFLVVVSVTATAIAQPLEQRDDPTPHLRLEIDAHTAPINAIAFSPDSERLYTAGEDKAVHVWRGAGGNWESEGRLRWEVGSNLAGVIYALAITPKAGHVAVAGYGNRGLRGEIVWLNADDGTYYSHAFPVNGQPNQHERSVWSMAMSPDGEWFASADLDGRVLLWPGENKAPQGAMRPHQTVYQRDNAQLENAEFKVNRRPVAFVGSDRLVYPKLQKAGKQPVWQIASAQPNVANPQAPVQVTALAGTYSPMLTALAGSSDRTNRFLAAADYNKLVLYQFKSAQSPAPITLETFRRGEMVYSLAFSPNGKYLAVGIELADGTGGIRLWDTIKRRQLPWRADTKFRVNACAFSPDGKNLAFVSGAGNDVSVAAFNSNNGAVGKVKELPGGAQFGLVGFAAMQPGDAPKYKVYFATGTVTNPQSWYEFDPAKSGEVRIARLPGVPANQRPSGFHDEDFRRAGWSVSLTEAGLTINHGKKNYGSIPLNEFIGGGITSYRWVCERGQQAGPPVAIAIATATNQILVYRLDRLDEPLRIYRGHEAPINYLNISPDQEYLISGARDGTVSIWPLCELTAWDESTPTDQVIQSKWGVTFEGNTIQSIDQLGPLFLRGLDVGDVLNQIEWFKNQEDEDQEPEVVTDFERIAADLRDAIYYRDVVFRATRGNDEIKTQSYPGWYPILSLYMRGDDWIAWTANGFFDSSFEEGAELIGWQFTRAMGQEPEFFTADQYHKTFRQKDVIEKVLATKAIPTGMVTESAIPKATDKTPDNSYRPQGNKLTVTGEFRVPPNTENLEARLFGVVVDENGQKSEVPIGERQTFSGDQLADGKVTAEQDVDLEKTLARSLFWQASTDSGFDDSPPKKVETKVVSKVGKGSLYVLAVGVSEYDEEKSGITVNPNGAAKDAQKIYEVFKQKYASEYIDLDRECKPLTGKVTADQIENELARIFNAANENDTVVFYYSGHGKEGTDDFYLVPADGGDALNASRFLLNISDHRCARTVIILDSCYSGVALDKINDTAYSGAHRKGKHWFFASSDKDALQEDGGSKFSAIVVEGLAGITHSEPDGTVTTMHLSEYIRSRERDLLTPAKVYGLVNRHLPLTTNKK